MDGMPNKKLRRMSESSFIVSKQFHYISEKTRQNKLLQIGDFKSKANHYYIMTEGGTPIYSRYGDEMDVSSILATISALISKYNYSGKVYQDLQ